MSPKYIALVVLGIIIFSSIFTFANVGYPTGNPIHIKINKIPKQQIIFVNQSLNRYAVGLNSSYFIPSGNATIWVQGFIYNSSSGTRINDTQLTVAAGPYSTYSSVSSNGYYRFGILKTGKANIAFYVYGYNTVYHYFDFITSGTVWLNLSFRPSEKYLVHGFTEYDGMIVPKTDLYFVHGVSAAVESGSDGSYNVSLYNGTYVIAVYKPGFASNATPDMISIDGHGLAQNISLTPSGSRSIVISGYVKNQAGKPVSNATVFYDGYTATSNSTGFYTINVSAGFDVMVANAAGYGYGNVTFMAIANESDVNITLPVADPMLGGSMSSSNIPINQTYLNGSSAGVYYLSGRAFYNSSGKYIPLTATDIRFAVSIQGTGFYVLTKTNDFGYYNITVLYGGDYNFSAYAVGFYPYNFFVKISNRTTYHNLYFTPVPASSYRISLDMSNSSRRIPYNVSVYSSGVLVGNFSFNGSGNISLIGGNYTFSIYAPGYRQLNVTRNVFSNTSINETLNPVASLGYGISESTQLAVPISGYPSTNSTSLYAERTINLDLKFMYRGSAVDSSEFEMFMNFDSAKYRYLGNTSSNGTDLITLYYSGHYLMRFYFLKYEGDLIVNVTGSGSATVNLSARTLYTLSFELYNYSKIFKLTNTTIPETGISLNANNFDITPALSDNGSRIFVNYTLPVSNYTFRYNNVSFVPYSYSTLLMANTSVSYGLVPYIIGVENESVASWHFSLYSNPGSAVSVSYNNETVSVENAYLLGPGTYSFDAYLNTADRNPANMTPITLNSTKTTEVVIFRVTNVLKNFTSEKTWVQISGVNAVEDFNITALSNSFVTGYIHNIEFIGLNISINNTVMYVNTSGVAMQVISVNSDNLSFSNLYIVQSTELQLVMRYKATSFTEYYREYLNGTIQEYLTNIEVT